MNIPNELPDSEEPKNGVRVGWSVQDASLQLGKYYLASSNGRVPGFCIAKQGKESQKK